MNGWHRTSRHERGYGARWDRIRQRILERDGYLCQCAECKRAGRATVATEVDHIIPRAAGGSDDDANLQAIARVCHQRKTIEENGGQARPRQRVGLDGWPIGRAR